jgi:hypothetical protein
MRKILLVSLGGTVGYVLGARAGRPAYDRIVDRGTGLASALGLERLVATAADASADVRDSAVSRFSTAVSTSADSIVDHLDPSSASLHEEGSALDTGVRG